MPGSHFARVTPFECLGYVNNADVGGKYHGDGTNKPMNILGWIIVGLMVGVILQNLTAPQSASTTKGRTVSLIAAIISVNIMSALDAASTIYLVAHNYSTELNPFMNAFIERNYLLFFAVKVSVTIFATLVCWYYYARKPRARTILKLVSRLYCALLAWHCLLLSSVLL